MAKVNQTRDVQAQTFGFQNAVNNASAGAAAESRACTISGLVVSGTTTFSHVAHDAEGMMILVSTNANFETPAAVLYGTVLSHTTGTSTAFTVDAWYTFAGAKQSGTAANSGDFYVLVPAAAPFWYIALTDSTSAVAGTETGTALGGTEISTNGLARAQAGTITRTVGSTAATLANTFTYTTSGAQNIGRCAICNSIVTGTNSGGVGNYAYFIDQINSGTPATVSTNGDTFTPTYTLTLG